MFTSFRHYRQFYNRRISVVLAVLIGLILGVGAFLVWQHTIHADKGGAFGRAQKTRAAITAIELQPHKSLYRVVLTGAHHGSQLIDIQGKMFYEVKQSCDTIITDHRFYLTYDYADSAPMRVTSDFSTAERADGRHFSFSSRRRRDGELYQELRGAADLARGKGGQAVYALPEKTSFSLTPETLFPAAEMAALINAAEKGQKFKDLTLFDGSDAEGPVQVTAVIGPPMHQLSDIKGFDFKKGDKALDQSLIVFPAWPVRLAFFPLNQESETADYELTMILHKNGVISDMTIDYEEFSVNQHLTALQNVPRDECGAEGENTLSLPSTGDALSPSLKKSDR